jgi:hypothetical protein
MKAIELELITGKWAMFFLSSGFVINERIKEGKAICVLHDNTHNNGGWELADNYDDVKSRLIKLFNMEGEQ